MKKVTLLLVSLSLLFTFLIPANVDAATTSATKADKVISEGKKLIGTTKYRYGVNKPPKYLDCSSFTKYVFAKVGVKLKWGTRYQKYAGKYVSKSKLKKGDLVFFKVGSSKSIGHVGIYVGKGKFMHNSPSFNGIGYSSLTSGYWGKRYVTARRVL